MFRVARVGRQFCSTVSPFIIKIVIANIKHLTLSARLKQVTNQNAAKESYWAICKPVCDRKIAAFSRRCHEVSVNCRKLESGNPRINKDGRM
jgi:hypothetical protein